jgi:hypothetical protein
VWRTNFVCGPIGDQLKGQRRWRIVRIANWATAPVSHQKRPHQNATNAIERTRNDRKVNEADRYAAAHNGLVAGSSPAGPTNEINRHTCAMHAAAGVHRKREPINRIPTASTSDEVSPTSAATFLTAPAADATKLPDIFPVHPSLIAAVKLNLIGE